MSLLLWSRQRFINTGHKQQFRERKKEEKNYKFALEIVKQKKKKLPQKRRYYKPSKMIWQQTTKGYKKQMGRGRKRKWKRKI